MPRQGHRNLGAKAGRQVQRILHRIAPAAAEVKLAEVRVHLLEVGDGRYNAVFQDLDRDHVLDADTHRMPGEALGVGHDNLVGYIAEGAAQGYDFSRRAAAAGRGEGLMRHEDHLRRHAAPIHAKAALGGGHQVVHDHRDVIYIEAGAVEGAVVGLAAQQLDDAAHAAFTHCVFTFDDQGARAHAQQGAMAAAVEGQGSLFHLVVGRSRAGRQEAGAHPFHQVIAGHIVRAHHDHTAAAAAADPVLSDGDALRGAGAGRVDLGVGAARADVFGELAVAHGQDAEDEAAIEDVWLAIQILAHRVDAAVQFQQRLVLFDMAAQFLQHLQVVQAFLPDVVLLHFAGETVAPGEGAGKDDAGFVAQTLRQHPAIGQEAAGAGALPGLHQRNAGLAQRVQARGHGQLRGDVQRFHQFVRHAVLGAQVEAAGAAGQFDHVAGVGNRLEAAAAIRGLDHTGDMFLRHLAAVALWNQIHKLFPAQNAHGVVGIHDCFVGAGQTQAGAADDDRTLRYVVAVEGLGRRLSHGLHHLRKHLAHHLKGLRRRYGRQVGHGKILFGWHGSRN